MVSFNSHWDGFAPCFTERLGLGRSRAALFVAIVSAMCKESRGRGGGQRLPHEAVPLGARFGQLKRFVDVGERDRLSLRDR